MISKALLTQVLLENRVLVEQKKIFPREIQLGEFPRCVLVGVRRSGKSYLLFQRMQRMLAAGKSWQDMLYVNFEDERLLGFDVGDFNRILEVHAEMTGSESRPALFLDEIQLIDGWEKFVRRMADAQAEIYVTGSNAKMLSVDVAASLGGRFITVNVFPLSFSEYLSAKGIDAHCDRSATTTGKAMIQRVFEEFFTFGGFPESLDLANKTECLNTLFQKIYLGDIVVRNKVSSVFSLRMLIKKIADSIGQPISYSRLAGIVNANGVKLAKNTCITYVRNICDSCVLLQVQNIVGAVQERETSPKYYFVDNGLIRLLKFDVTADLLEHVVALHLLRTYGLNERVFFYTRQAEVDFFVPDEGLAIQACVALGNDPDTVARETGAFDKLAKEFTVHRRVIVTLEEERTIESDKGSIEVVPAWKWLLQTTASNRQVS